MYQQSIKFNILYNNNNNKTYVEIIKLKITNQISHPDKKKQICK